MLKKIIGLFTGSKKEQPQKEVIARDTSQATVLETVDYSKFIRAGDRFFRFTDYDGELKSLSDNFFEGHESAEIVHIYLQKVEELPSSMNRFAWVLNLSLTCPKLKYLPDFIADYQYLEILEINCTQMRVDERFSALKKLGSLTQLSLSNYYGSKWPSVLETLVNIQKLSISFDEKKTDQLEMVRSIGRMKWLKEVSLMNNLNLEQIGEEITALDHLDSISCWATSPKTYPEFLNWGLLRHVSFPAHYQSGEMTFDDFKAAIHAFDFGDNTRRLLFGIYAKNFNGVKALLPNQLLAPNENGQPTALFFEYKPAKSLLDRIKEQIGRSGTRLATTHEQGCLHIISEKNSFAQVLELVRQGKTLLLEDHIKEWLTAVEDPWLRQSESQEANEQVYRLLTSNQVENYLLAFQIIEGGGANDELVSLIAAIMLSHPDQKVAKTAEKLFAKVGPSNALNVFKQKKISFRRSGETVKTLNRLFQTDIGITSIPFRLLHGLIAGENPVIKDVQPGELSFKDCQFNEHFPDCARFFEQFTSVDFSRSKGLDVAGALRIMAHWPSLKRLDFSGCHYQIPASIGNLRQLTHLDLTSNTLENSSALAELTNLVQLSVEGCKIKSWQWLGKLDNLETLNMARNELASLPKELAGMTGLRSLSLSQNKLKTIEEALFSLYSLSDIDLSNNQISELDYRLFSRFPLNKLSLRSNKISQLDPARLLAATGGRPCGVWELNLAGNALTAFKVEKNMFSRLSILDISKNKITELHDGIFRFTSVKNLFASDNQIAEIPPSIAGKYMQKLFLDKNRIAMLPEYFSTAHIENCDLRHNQIERIPDSFKRKDKDDFSRLYWKLENNPIGGYPLL